MTIVQDTKHAPAPRRMSKRAETTLMVLPVVVLLAFLFVIPTIQFLFRAFQANDGSLTLANIERLMANTSYLTVMWQTLKISFWVTVITIIVAYPVAYVLARADRSSKSYWALFVLLPFWSSFLVRTFAVIVMLGRNGPLNDLVLKLGLSESPVTFLYSYGSVLFGITNVLTPFAILTMIGVMERIDPRLISAAQSMGAHPVQGFFRVFLPLSMPGVTAASLLVFITSLGFFITPALLGSERETMMAQPIIQQVIDLANWPFAAVLCCVLFLATVVVFAIFNYTVGLSSLVGEPRQQGAKETGLASKFLRDAVGLIGDVIAAPLKRIRARRGYGLGAGRSTKVFAFIVLFTLNVPVLFLVPVSVADGSFVVWPSTGFSIRWYGEYFTDPMWLDATFRSFRVALLTAAGCFVLGVPTALAAMRMSGKTAGALFVLVISPMILPKMIIAVGLFYLYAKIGLVGTDAGLVLGHIVVALPFFFISTLAVLRTYDKRLDHAAASLGASPWKTLRYVTLPLIMTGLISASLFAFIISLDELNIALFTSGGLASTLPKMMWENATLGFTPLLAAVSTTFLLFLTILVLVSIWLTSRRSA